MSVMRYQRRKANVNEAMSGDDGGFVIVWMALMLLVLLAFCGFGIDVAHWWFVGQKEQRAADAAALAGSIYMPNDLPSAQAIALRVSAQNGYKNGVNANGDGDARAPAQSHPGHGPHHHHELLRRPRRVQHADHHA